MRFLVSTAAKSLGIVNPVVCLYKGVVSTNKSEAYDDIIKDLMSRMDAIRTEIIPTDTVQGFRKLYANVNSKVTPAGERLVDTCKKKGLFPRYGNLVDAYNIVAFEKVTPIGVHDGSLLADDQRTLIFRTAHGNERIIPSFKTKEYTIRTGDFTYGVMQGQLFDPFAWLGAQDVDSSKYQLKEETTTMLLTAIGHATTTQGENVNICERVFKLIRLTCPDATMEICLPEFFEDEEIK